MAWHVRRSCTVSHVQMSKTAAADMHHLCSDQGLGSSLLVCNFTGLHTSVWLTLLGDVCAGLLSVFVLMYAAY